MKASLLRPRPRLLRQLLSRSALRKLFVLLLVWSIVEAQLVYYRIARAQREFETQDTALQKPTRVFIASLHWNNANILRSDWNKGVVDLVKTFGPENVFVSVYESGSWDDSKDALRELDRELDKTGVGKKITMDDITHEELIKSTPNKEGWITVPSGELAGKMAPRRIPYLSRLRNLTLQPLLELAKNGTTFDYVLFLGDVVFDVSDVIGLLNTNDGHYAAACSLDFSKPPLYYDTFALRDAKGHEHATQTWPYFRSSKSRNAMLNGLPVPVASCWNGIVAMPTSAFTGIKPLTFRGVDDTLAESHLEGSECCLIHADNPASRTRGVFLNPNVRVGYNRAAYEKVHTPGSWLSLPQIYFGLWKNRIARRVTTPWLKENTVARRIRKWQQQGNDREEPGWFCLINEMQIIVYNGWKHL
ncbi:cryptococcal mannosyltransferase 1-domain-containing protein [Cercophora newfieldiana]|uniref:Cryptococcal mannosyltransferase 1-domain-containing protein n=1 Tax=Cercophora newfieldiana TaxID=92897 RepID=A0AA40CLD1_9PEZI|nr:cryptococcal mannosyltransferase 1-domain-containing protein [Cercophora newfieldiana]